MTAAGDRAAVPVAQFKQGRLREVNYIKYDVANDQMLVATSRGVAVFGGSTRSFTSVAAEITKEQNGIVDNSVSHISLMAANKIEPGKPGMTGSTMVLATSGGVTEINGGRARSITAFHGLPSKYLYTSAIIGSRIYVGSNAGLVELEGLRVIRTYKMSNSSISDDWVTALAVVEGTLFIGTHLGGVDALLPTGEWINFADELGRFEVNQNAMHYDGERLYVGTADNGLLVYNSQVRRWSRFDSGLTSNNVSVKKLFLLK